MNHKKVKRLCSRTLLALVFTAVFLTIGPNASAVPIITQTGTSGGFPGFLPVYEVSNLAEGDVIFLNWFFEDEDFTEINLFEISATGKITVTDVDVDMGRLLLDIILTNTSDLTYGIRITSFGLSVDDFNDVNDSDTDGDHLPLAVADSQFPGFNDVVVCATVPTGMAENCAGGGNGGIGDMSTMSYTDSFFLDLDGDFASTVTLNDFAIKVQSDIRSYELPGVPSTLIPEPSTLILLGLGLSALGLLSRRRGNS